MTTQYLELGKQERRNKICGSRHSAKGALKARFTFGAGSLNGDLKLNRAFSACLWLNRIPGALFHAKGEAAPLALNTAASGID